MDLTSTFSVYRQAPGPAAGLGSAKISFQSMSICQQVNGHCVETGMKLTVFAAWQDQADRV
jgi:hypothetical protein